MRGRREFVKRRLLGSKYIPYEKRKSRLMVFIFLWGIIFTYLTQNFVFCLEVIKGSSMSPSFKEGGYHLANKFVYFFREPQRGDVVIIKNIWSEEAQLVKRVVGVPYDIVEIRNGRVYINNMLLEEPYANGETRPDLGPIVIGEDMYFLLGDNRENSADSRIYGPVRKGLIKGRLSPNQLFSFE